MLEYAYRASFDGTNIKLKGSGLKKSSTKKGKQNSGKPKTPDRNKKIINNLKKMLLLLGKASADIRYLVDKNYKVSLEDCLLKLPYEQLEDRLGGMELLIAVELAQTILTNNLQKIFESYEK